MDKGLYPRFYDSKSGELLFQIKEIRNSNFGDLNANGSIFIGGNSQLGSKTELIVYNLINKDVIKRVPGVDASWAAGAFAGNNTAWVSKFNTSIPDDYDKGRIVIFDIETWEQRHEIERVITTLIKSSPDGRYVGYRDGAAIVVRNTETYEIHKTFGMDERINDFAFSPDGTMIAGTCKGSNSLMIWDLETGEKVNEIYDTNVWGFASLVYSPNSKYIIADAYGDKIPGMGVGHESRVFQNNDLKKVHVYPGGAADGIDISDNSEYIAMADYTGIVVYYSKWGETSVSDIPEEENIIYPNPATGILNIMLDIKKSETIDVNIYDTSGNIITNIFNGIAEPGTILTWNSSENPSGTYYCKVDSRSFNRTYKIIVSK
jgi:WD40 repeat protein